MSTAARRPLVGGNWKMHLLAGAAEAYCRALPEKIVGLEVDVVLFASPTLLAPAAAALAGSGIPVGGQDLHAEDQGAHTGDVSGPQLADAGATWVLCGHSERRRDHGEDDATVARKVEAAARHHLTPMICVGETSEERRAGHTFEVLGRQLDRALAARPASFAIAYEPVWAIGTGDTATPEIAQQAHRFLRETLADVAGDEVAAAKRIVYGGSANPDNAGDLFAQPDVDGFLVGGASLDPDRFSAIIRVCGGPA